MTATANISPKFLGLGSMDPHRLRGRCFTSPEGEAYRVHKEFVRVVRLHAMGFRAAERSRTVSRDELLAWREHKLPSMIRVGDKLVADGEQVVVSDIGVMGGVNTIGLTGRWGFETGHTHENGYFVNFLSSLLAENVRLPFEGESFDQFGRPVAAAA